MWFTFSFVKIMHKTCFSFDAFLLLLFLICWAYGRKYNKHPFSFSFIICFGSVLIFFCVLFCLNLIDLACAFCYNDFQLQANTCVSFHDIYVGACCINNITNVFWCLLLLPFAIYIFRNTKNQDSNSSTKKIQTFNRMAF